MPDTTNRLGIVTPLGTEGPNTNAAYKAIADAVDALAAIYGQGTIAARPVSTPGSPGIAGRFYTVTSAAGGGVIGAVYYDHGTGWYHINPDQTVGPDSITATEIAAGAVGGSELADGSVDAAAIIDGVVGTAEIANALKPSAGAGAAVEALRALGTAAGTAAAGTHASQHASAGADPLPADSVGATQIAAGAVGASEIADGSVGAAEIADGSVGDAELGNSYIRANADGIKVQSALDGGLVDGSGNIAVTFPVAFGAAPVVVAVPTAATPGAGLRIGSVSASQVVIVFPGLNGDSVAFHWVAVGPA